MPPNARVQGDATAATPLLRLPWNAMLCGIGFKQRLIVLFRPRADIRFPG